MQLKFRIKMTKISGRLYANLHPLLEAEKSVGCSCSWSLAFMVKVIVWYFVSDIYKFMTTVSLIVLVLVLLEWTE
jgi:hypothetical protein